MQQDLRGVYSPSDGSEGPILRDHVNETIALEHLNHHEPISMPSPRTELLSNLGNESADNDREARLRRGPTERYRRERESVYKHTSHNDLLRVLIEQEYEASKMRKTLYMVFAQLEGETQRANEFQKQVEETLSRVGSLNQRTLDAEAEARSLREELNLYKIHYEMAQNRITKAQTVLATLRSQKDDAETMARKARGDARKVKEVLGVWKAREEGRKQGFEAGWRRARAEFGLSSNGGVLSLPYESAEGQMIQTTQGGSPELGYDDDFGDDISYMAPAANAEELRIPDPPPDPFHSSLPRPAASSSGHRPTTSHHSHSAEFEPAPPVPQNIPPSQPPPPRAPSALGARTPAMERFSINIPPADSVVVNQNINPPKPTRTNSLKRLAAPLTWRPGAHRDRPPSPHPPDNYIPSITEEGIITLPPPHEMGDYVPTPRSQLTDLPEAHHNRSVSLDAGLGAARLANSSAGRTPRLDAWYGDLDNRGTPSLAGRDPGGNQTAPGHQQPGGSWYTTQGTASIQSQDYAYPEPIHRRQASLDSNLTGDSRISNMDILRGPEDTFDDAEPAQKQGGTFKNIFRNPLKGKGKARQLSVINENPLSRQGSLNAHPHPQASPRREPVPSPSQFSPRAPSPQPYTVPSGQGQGYGPEARHSHSNSNFSQRSTDLRNDRPPRNVRVPAQLTVPAPLSPQNQRVSRTVSPEQMMQQQRMRTTSASSMGSGFYQNPPSQTRSNRSFAPSMHSQPSSDRGGARRMGSTTSPPVGITVEPPSQTPSEQPPVMPSGGTSRISLNPDPQASPNRFQTNAGTSSPRPPSDRLHYPYPRPDDWVDTVPNTPESAPMTWSVPPSSNKGKARADPYDPQRPITPSNNHYRSSSRSGAPNGAPYPNTLDTSVPNEGGSNLKRVSSNASIRSTGSYSRYDPTTYKDPAFFGSQTDLNAGPSSRAGSAQRSNY
ncbi:hypothetical protein PM082_004619 [Marasmius tenuissimus]|nr:hypothetical protein PM082_004619 [Marasmius tenuissimus]